MKFGKIISALMITLLLALNINIVSAKSSDDASSFITQSGISFKLPDGWKFDKITNRGISCRNDKQPGEIVIFKLNPPNSDALRDSARVGMFRGFALQTVSQPYGIADSLIGMNYNGWDNNETVIVRAAFSTLFNGGGAAILAIVGKDKFNKSYEEDAKFIGLSIQEYNSILASKAVDAKKSDGK